MASALYNVAASTIPLQVLRTNLVIHEAAKKWFIPSYSATKFLTSAPTVESIPDLGSTPEVIFVGMFITHDLVFALVTHKPEGRANVGKSTLINYICNNKDLAISSKKPGRTQALNFFGLQRLQKSTSPRPDLVLVDAPGYGQRGRPEWGVLFDHYIRTRDTLRCIYLLINAQHGPTEHDKMMLRFLDIESNTRSFKIQPIITKTDRIQAPKLTQTCVQVQGIIQEIAPKCLPVIYSTAGSRDKRRYGRIEIRSSILEQCRVLDKSKS